MVTGASTPATDDAAAEAAVSAAWQQVVADSPCDAPGQLALLLTRYREPHRRYHTLSHLACVLAALDELATNLTDGDSPHDLAAVRLAALFHDAVYQPQSHDNEAASSVLAAECARQLGWSDARAGHVAAMVLATAGHTEPQRADGHHDSADASEAVARAAADTAVLLDADLSVLAADSSVYAAYTKGVRAEYAHVADDAWQVGRARILRGLLAHHHLYSTPFARERWEARARANLLGELAELEELAALEDQAGSPTHDD